MVMLCGCLIMSSVSFLSHFLPHKRLIAVTNHVQGYLKVEDVQFIYLLNAVGKIERDRELEVNFGMLKKQLAKKELDNLLSIMKRVYKKVGRQDFTSLIANPDQLDIFRPSTGRSSEHNGSEQSISISENALQLRNQAAEEDLPPGNNIFLSSSSNSSEISRVSGTNSNFNSSGFRIASKHHKNALQDNNILGALLDNQRNGVPVNQDADQQIWEKMLSEYMEYLQKHEIAQK
jgi:hypothetical protein